MMKPVKNLCIAVASAAFVALVSLGCMTPADSSTLRADPNWDSAPVDISAFEDPTQQ